MAQNSESFISILGAAVFGLVAGFIGAVLTTPKSGQDLRDGFWEKIDEIEKGLDEELSDRGLL